ncbi:hypothetical protein [Nocardia brasiliensis]|uniref:hypothetical protein n=1 Tax=Nocardia brasiliensis TaxID=37326 RepID=UPI002453E636|nr:hypothetical protein [Nocardia brasiliensis]
MTSTTRYEAPGFGASVISRMLHSPMTAGLRRNLTELRYQGRLSGRHVALPVSYARSDDNVVVRVARAHTKSWWRNFRTPRPLSVWLDGRWQYGTGHVTPPGSLEHEEVAAVYQAKYPRMVIPATDPFVVIELQAAHNLPSTGATEPKHGGLWRRWCMSVTLGELFGFAAPALAGALVRDAAPATAALALLAAGALEGTVLGWFQARVLHTVIPGLRRADWILATALGALLAWTIGVIPVVAGEGLGSWPPAVVIPAATIGGVVILLSIGGTQWLVMRRHIHHAGQWIRANAAAWLVALLVFTAITTPLWQPGQSTALVALIGLFGGLLMALTMAAVSGAFLVRILRSNSNVEWPSP